MHYRDEIAQARKNRCFRGCFGSIIRREPSLIYASKDEINRFCEAIGAPDYYAEAKKTLNAMKYDLEREKANRVKSLISEVQK